MADYKVTDAELTGIADAIRTKGGTSSPLVFPNGFSTAIGNLPSEPVLGTKSITQNGTYVASDDSLDGYSSVDVSVQPSLGTKSITQNGTYYPSDDSLDGYGMVTVSLQGGGTNPDKDQTGATVIGTDTDDNEYQIERNSSGELEKTKLISSIYVDTPPTKLSYVDGETIDYTGIVVGGKYGDLSLASTIPNEQLVFPMSTADKALLEPYTAIRGNKVTDFQVTSIQTLRVAYLGKLPPYNQMTDGDTYEFDNGRLSIYINSRSGPKITAYIDGTQIGAANYNINIANANVGYTELYGGSVIFYVSGGTTPIQAQGHGIVEETIIPLVPVNWTRQQDSKLLSTGFQVSVS